MSLVIDKPDLQPEQYARTPLEVLANINKHWLEACIMAPQANFPVFDNLLTILYAMEVYAEVTHTSMEDVRMRIRPIADNTLNARFALLLDLDVPQWSPAWYGPSEDETDFKVVKDRLYARVCMREDVQRELGQFLNVLHGFAERDDLQIDDYESREYPFWIARDTLLMRLWKVR